MGCADAVILSALFPPRVRSYILCLPSHVTRNHYDSVARLIRCSPVVGQGPAGHLIQGVISIRKQSCSPDMFRVIAQLMALFSAAALCRRSVVFSLPGCYKLSWSTDGTSSEARKAKPVESAARSTYSISRVSCIIFSLTLSGLDAATGLPRLRSYMIPRTDMLSSLRACSVVFLIMLRPGSSS